MNLAIPVGLLAVTGVLSIAAPPAAMALGALVFGLGLLAKGDNQ